MLTLTTFGARSKKQIKNIALSFIFRAGALASSLVTVPLSISYLSVSSFGTWQVIFSVLSWTTLFDFGLGNGLKSRLTEAIAQSDSALAARYVSTYYAVMVLIALAVIGLFSAVHPFLDWYKILNVGRGETYLGELVWMGVAVFAARLVLDSINSILLAYQKAALAQLNTFLGALGSLGGVWALSQIALAQPLRLPALGLAVSVLPAMVSLLVSLYFFYTEFSMVRPATGNVYPPFVKRLFSLGGQFFIIQIAALVIYSTDNLLVSKFFGSSQVAIYNVAFKLFSCFTIVWNIIITPYWVAFGEAYLHRDYDWIKKNVRSLLYLWLGLVAVLLVTVQFSDQVYHWWVGRQISIPTELSVAMAVSVAITCLSNVFAYFVNGVGKIRLQLVVSMLAAIVNIPLAVFLSKSMGLGLKGIILATSICIFFCTVFIALQCYKIISRRASGVWDR